MKSPALGFCVLISTLVAVPVLANTTPHSLAASNFAQNWANTGLITADDDWSGVPSIVGFRGDNLTGATGTNPQTLTADDTPGVVDVIANQTAPNTNNTGGVAEFQITDPVVALQGSGTADAPYLQIYLDTTGRTNINISYNVRDIDGSVDNATQQLALQYRVGNSGTFTDIPAGYIADATTGPSLATLVTPRSVTLPSAADNQPLVQIRIMTTNAVGNDEWVGIDDIVVTSTLLSVTPTLNINDVTVTEGNAGTVTASFMVSLTSPAGAGGVTFDIATQDNTATTADSDYVSRSLIAQTIPAGSSNFAFDVTVNGDINVEPNETFFVNVTNIVGATAGDTQGQGTITNDDSPPDLTVNDVTVTEGSTTITATFTVSLSSPAQTGGVTFDIATQDNTATTADNDYVARSLLAQSIPAGSTTYMFDVTVNGDTAFEPTETFFVNVTGVTGATVTDGQGVGTITNDDAAPSITIADQSAIEGNAGTSVMTFTVTVTPTPTQQVTVDYATADVSAAAGSDYVTANGTLTFNPGVPTQTFDVTINGDVSAEGDEMFVVNLTAPTNATIGDNQATGTIRNDDPFSIAAVNTPYSENFNALSTTGFASTTPVAWTFVEGGANANSTYRTGDGGSNTGDTYSFGTGTSTDRAFGALLSGSINSTIGAFYRNDTGVTVTTLSISYTGEQWRLGTASRVDRIDFQYSTNATSLTTGTWTDVNGLDFSTPNTTTTGAKDGNAAANRTNVSFTATGLAVAPGGTFWIRWTDLDASGADDGLSVDDFTIIANIAGGVLTISDVTVTEGNSGTATATFTVSLSSPAGVGGVTFDIATADNTATTADNDYVAQTLNSQNIPEGSTTYMFDVTINGDTNVETSESFFVNVTNVGGAVVNDGQALGTIATDDFTFTPIHTVQGSGLQSPLNGSAVTVTGIVTGIKSGGSGGFFVQETDATADADSNTSEGIFVFSPTLPAGVVIGNRVAVSGTVVEFPASASPHTVTELGGTIGVSLLATGEPLPTPAVITAADGAPTANVSNYERFEGMLVTTTLTAITGTDGSTNEANATGTSNGVFYGVVAGVPRPMREPGIPLTDPIPAEASCPACIPRFDNNREKIRVDSDNQPGALQLNVVAGQTIANLIGPLDFGFLEYTILPNAATPPTVTGPNTFTAVPTPTATELTVGSFNLERFFDTVDEPGVGDAVLTPTAFNNRLNKASLAIRNVLRSPDVLGVVEVENLTTLQALATKINIDSAGTTNYQAYLIEGNDVGGIDVGFLVNALRVTVVTVTQEGDTATFTNPNNGASELLNDRPPLLLMATAQRPDGSAYPFTVIVNHLRSLIGVELDDAEGRRVRAKRRAQGEFLANLVQTRQSANPAERIILVGDFNAFEVSDGLVDVIGTIKGTPTPASDVVLASPDLVNPDLVNLVVTLPASQRYSFVFDGNAQVLDHAIVNAALFPAITRVAYARLDADFPEIYRSDATRPERLSDHDAIIAYVELTPANQPPVNTVPGPQTIYANSTLVFSTANGNAISIADPDAGSQPVAVTLTATNGTLTLASVAGLSFTSGDGINDATMSFTGSIANINAALNGMSFTPTAGFTGGASLQITTNDQGNTGAGGPRSDTDTVAITVTALPQLSINDVTVTESDGVGTVATFTVTLAPASTATVTVNFGTANGTAVAGSDYTASMGMLTFNPTVTTQTINVPISGDTVNEPTENFFVNLTGATNATIADAQGTGTINDNDAAPPAPSADVAITKTAPAAAGTNMDITFDLAVRNNGPSSATAVTVTDVLPAGVTFVSATPSQGSCSGTTTVTCALGTLATSATATVAIVVRRGTTGAVVNTATISAAEIDFVPANNTSTSTTAVVDNIPTLSEWMLAALALALMAAAVTKLKV